MFVGFFEFIDSIYQRQLVTPLGTLFAISIACFGAGLVSLVFRFVKSLNIFS